jgi:hypothetical protein
VNSHKNQIQALIEEIDSLLGKSGGRSPWGLSNEVALYRRLLERIRSSLVSLLQSIESSGSNSYQAIAESATLDGGKDRQEQFVQTFMQKLGREFSQFMQPLQADVERLLSQRQALMQEIAQLELNRQRDYSLAQQQANQQQVISEFLHVLSSRMQESLTQQFSQVLANIEAQRLELEVTDSEHKYNQQNSKVKFDSSLEYGNRGSEDNFLPLPLHPRERLEQLRLLQNGFDRRLLELDSTLNVVFETLQRNIQSYSQSLSQALEGMQQMATQGELIFATLLGKLAQQSGQQLSPVAPSLTEFTPSEKQATNASFGLPYPGIELHQELSQAEPQATLLSEAEAVTLPSLSQQTESEEVAGEAELDSMLEELGVDLSQTASPPPPTIEAPTGNSSSIDSEVDEVPKSSEDLISGKEVLDSSSSELSPNSETSETELLSYFLGQLSPGPLGQHDEVDELYESLFGSNNSLVAAQSPSQLNEVESNPRDVRDEIFPQTSMPIEEPSSADTISALTDLLGNNLSEEQIIVPPEREEVELSKNSGSLSPSTANVSDNDSETKDNDIQVLPVEDLLASEEPENELVHDILLDPKTLEQLHEDLSDLERTENVLPVPESRISEEPHREPN